MNRVLGLGLFVPADAERVGLKAVAPWTVLARTLDEPPAYRGEAIAMAHAFELRSFVYSRGFRQVLNSRNGRMR